MKIPAINTNVPNIGFNLKAQDNFVQQRGIKLEHWAAIPSPIGLKDRGEYRRSETLDTFSSNGFIYKKMGEFTGVIVSNSKHDAQTDGGILDVAGARLVLPRYYDPCKGEDKKEIAMLPGDRIYAKNIELKVSNYQRVEFVPGQVDFLQFPAKTVSFCIDSLGNEFKFGKDFKLDKDGNIKWVTGKKNPSIDPDTGKGRVYSVRYEYLAFWYVESLINEIRITNDDTANEASRMPYHVSIQREYVYHNRVKPAKTDINSNKEDSRTNQGVVEQLDDNEVQVKVNMSYFEE